MNLLRERLSNATELLDSARHDHAELEQSLAQVAEVNRLLGGRRAVLRSLAPLFDRRRTLRILDVGTGSADKTQVSWMIARLLPTAGKTASDSADALAVAIAHAHARTARRVA